jgi:Ca-activated chloride channel homolog
VSSDLMALLKTFRFESWWFLFLLLLIPIWAWLRGRVAPVAAVEFHSGDLLRAAARKPHSHRRRWLMMLRFLALTLLILALARPQVEKGLSDFEAKGVNIMLVLDWSGTMKKKDFIIENKRATRAQALVKVISEFMRARPQDRIGLVRFDADAFLISPLTLDHDYLITRLKEEKNGRGTAPGSGMLIAAEALLGATNQSKVMIVVTDAEQVNQGPPPAEVCKAIVPYAIKTHVIQMVDFKDMAHTSRQWNEMAEVPKLTGGQFFQVADFVGLRSVYRMIDRLEKATFKEDKQRNWRELMGWFAVPALSLLLLELLLRQTVWRRLP